MMYPGNFILSYDISDDHERNRVERVAERFGTRLHKSVFWCLLENRSQREALEAALDGLNVGSGTILLAPTRAWAETSRFGGGILPALDEGAWLVQ
jgi:CRISPR-associated endonuclease Cas2